jgi:hypothetical protein
MQNSKCFAVCLCSFLKQYRKNCEAYTTHPIGNWLSIVKNLSVRRVFKMPTRFEIAVWFHTRTYDRVCTNYDRGYEEQPPGTECLCSGVWASPALPHGLLSFPLFRLPHFGPFFGGPALVLVRLPTAPFLLVFDELILPAPFLFVPVRRGWAFPRARDLVLARPRLRPTRCRGN